MNKKGQVGNLFFVLALLAGIGFIIMSSVPTSHDDCMSDCNKVFIKDYQYQTQCYDIFNKSITYQCNKVNRTYLRGYCFDRCTNYVENKYMDNIKGEKNGK